MPEKSFRVIAKHEAERRYWSIMKLVIFFCRTNTKSISSDIVAIIASSLQSFQTLVEGSHQAVDFAEEFIFLIENIRDSVTSSPSPEDVDISHDQIKKSANVISIEDDFLDATSATSRILSVGRVDINLSAEVRFKYPAEILNVLSSFALCFFACSFYSDESISVLRNVLLTSGASKSIQLDVSSEIFLDIAESISWRCASTAILKFASFNNWDKEFGMLGYQRLLIILNKLLLSHSTTGKENLSMEPEIIAKILFAQGELFEVFVAQFWSIPFLQMKCSSIFLNTNTSLVKESFPVCLLAMIDSCDYRTRLLAAMNVPMLLNLFSKHEKIYASVREQIEASLQCEDPYRVATSAITVAAMASVSKSIVKNALIDMMIFCCKELPRFKSYGVASSSVDLLQILISFIAIHIGYCTSFSFVIEYSKVILHHFIVGKISSNISDFPFSIYGYRGVAQFAEEQLGQILVVYSQLDDRLRFQMLQQLSVLLKFGPNESSIAAMIRSSAMHIKAAEFMFYFNGVKDKNSDLSTYSTHSKNVQLLLFRNASEQHINKAIHENVSDVVKELFMNLCFVPPVDYYSTGGSEYITTEETLLFALSSLAAKTNLTTIEELFGHVNIDFLIDLREKFKASQTIKVQRNILSGFIVITGYLPDTTSRYYYRAILTMCIYALRSSSDLLRDTVRCIEVAVNRLLAFTQAKKKKKGNRSSGSDATIIVLEEYFFEIVQLAFSLNMHSSKNHEPLVGVDVTAHIVTAYSNLHRHFESLDSSDKSIICSKLCSLTQAIMNESSITFQNKIIPLSISNSFTGDFSSFRNLLEAKTNENIYKYDPLQNLSDSLEVYSAGGIHTLTIIWMKMLNLYEYICQPHNKYIINKEISARCISSMLLFAKNSSSGFCKSESLILAIIGRLPSFDSSVNPMSYRPFDAVLPSDSNGAKSMIIVKLHTSTFTTSHRPESISILRHLRHSGILEEILTKFKSDIHNEIISCYKHHVAPSQSYIANILSACSLKQSAVWVKTSSIWKMEGKSFSTWIRNLAGEVILESYSHFLVEYMGNRKEYFQTICTASNIFGGDPFYACFAGMSNMSRSLAEELFILCVSDIIRHNGIDSRACVSITECLIENVLSDSSFVFKESIQLCCRLLVYLLRQDFERQNKRILENVPLRYDFGLHIDLSIVCGAALRCGYPCTALLLYELWLDFSADNENEYSISKTLFRIYKELNEPDELRGISKFSDLEQEPIIASQSGQWVEAVMGYECLLQLGTFGADQLVAPQDGISNALSSLGADYLLSRSTSIYNDSLSSLSQWSDVNDQPAAYADHSVEKMTYKIFNSTIATILKDMKCGEYSSSQRKAVYSASCAIPDLHLSLYAESSKVLFAALDDCKELSELVTVASALSDSRTGVSGCSSIIKQWDWRNDAPSIKSRFSLIQIMLSSKRLNVFDAITFAEHMCSALSSKLDAFKFSPVFFKLKNLVISNADKLSGSDREILLSRWYLSESVLLSKKLLPVNAINTIEKEVIQRLQSIHDNIVDWTVAGDIMSEAFRMEGEWAASTRRGSEKEIVSSYLEPAVSTAQSLSQRIKAHLTLGEFNAKLHASVVTRKASQEWREWIRVAEDRVSEYQRCMLLLRKLRDVEQRAAAEKRDLSEAEKREYKQLNNHCGVLSRECAIDNAERLHMEKSLETLLINAIDNFGRVLMLSPEQNLDAVFQVVNLWLSNIDSYFVSTPMHNIVIKCPSFKFVPLHYQIISRLGTSGDDSQALIIGLIIRLSKEHPYHILPQLLAILNEKKGQCHNSKTESRYESACKIVKTLRQFERTASLLDSTGRLLEAYIDLALLSTSKEQNSGKTRDIAFRDLQSREKCFSDCLINMKTLPAVVTLSIDLDASCSYSNVVRVVSFVKTFDITDTGVSRPKIIQCEGSDGILYKQLVKGGDDLRQDAVMQQVFDNVNFTLTKDVETRKRSLSIRTYKIVALTSQTGVIEWVSNTVPFGSFLTDRDRKSGAHSRYYPKDWKHDECREKLKKAREESNLRLVFGDICDHFHPVFRYFFVEQFADPVRWLSSRMTYIRSVAATSMVGYVLGIGDRHSHNILIDTATSEVVHIDFGIVFEQGKVLPTPETVPFRLTRDIVDGMGVTGVNGTFKRSCEETLRVLRLNTSLLLTILEVVIHDPFYKWKLSPKQVRQRQYVSDFNGRAQEEAQEESRVDKDAAERTIIRIKNKLQGYDESAGEGLSVEGQVEILINEARSMDNLCRLYPGWAPWL